MYRFNDPITDAEHDLIIQKFSHLCEIVALDNYDPQARRDLLELFLHYTSEHFRREETLMRKVSYPGLEAHTDGHAYMQEAFQRLREAMSPDTPNLRADLGVMRQMFLQHILTLDDAFGAWLAATQQVHEEGGTPGLCV